MLKGVFTICMCAVFISLLDRFTSKGIMGESELNQKDKNSIFALMCFIIAILWRCTLIWF